ncbi:hypothetical protein PLESTM_000942800 [Pleodorina starrii]|nr:hypothetical protein PLESTM_000942800 [Pleodorina starrii]
MHLQPLASGDVFVPEAVVRDRLEQRRKFASEVHLDAASCSDFKAAKFMGSRNAFYDRMGVAAFVCRHGFVASMASLMTPENFVYYEVMLEALNEKMALEEVDVIFLDVACKFEGYYNRFCVAEAALPEMSFAIGPWHIKPHKPECNVCYNSRYMPGLGLTFGDLVEHLWAHIRRHWYISAYMSPAARQDFLSDLVDDWHARKEQGLPKQLLQGLKRALEQRVEIEAKLANLGIAIPTEPEREEANPRVRLMTEAARLEEDEAAKAKENPSAVRPSLKGKAPWTRSYLADLERFYLLRLLVEKSSAVPGNRPLREARLELEAVEKRLQLVEVGKDFVRWAQTSTEYKAATKERKGFEIARAERVASGLAASLAGIRDAQANRGMHAMTKKEVVKQQRRYSQARESLVRVLMEMQQRLGDKGSFPWLHYGVEDIERVLAVLRKEPVVDSAGLNQQSHPDRAVLPWEQAAGFKWELTPAEELTQRWFRCGEEGAIIEGELMDMVVLYICKVQLLQERLSELQSSATALSAVVDGVEYDRGKVAAAIQEAFGGQEIYKEQATFGEVGMAQRANEVLLGMLRAVTEEQGRCERLLTAAREAQAAATSLMKGQSTATVGGAGFHEGWESGDDGSETEEEEEEEWEANAFEVADGNEV